MRRDYFDVTLRSGTAPELVVTYDGPDGELSNHIQTVRTADDIDVAFRHRTADSGVLSLTDRITGEFVLEATVSIETIDTVVSSAKQASDSSEYALRLIADGTEQITSHNQTLLVYSSDGDLLRDRSLVSESIEL
jgi:hypothetical protein